MNENILRWKARIGSLKGPALVVALVAVFILIGIGTTLRAALNNTGKPRAVTISQLAKNEIGVDQYVTVSGTAQYDLGYQATKNDKPSTDYFYLAEGSSRTMILVMAHELIPDSLRSQTPSVTLTGLTRSAPSDLRKLIEDDLPDIHEANLETTATLFLGEGQKPEQASVVIAEMMALAMIVFLCVIPFLFPNTVFGPQPGELSVAPASGDADVRATGRFQRLASVRPSIQIGKGTRQFKEGIANVVPLEGRNLMIYIHHILTTRAYGIPIRKQETDWGIFVTSSNVVDIEPGKLYGWKDRWAVRLRYRDEKEKQQELIVSFNHSSAQASFVNLLRQMGFAISVGDSVLA